MCATFYITIDEKTMDEIRAEIEKNRKAEENLYTGGTEGEQDNLLRTGYIYPGYVAPVIVPHDGKLKPAAMVWGFPKKWGDKKPMFNARDDTIRRALEDDSNKDRSERMMERLYREPAQNRRLLIPMDGFYEWAPDETGKKQMYYFSRPDGGRIYIAGFYSLFSNEQDGKMAERFDMITTEPSRDVKDYHARMPAIVWEQDVEAYLCGDKFMELLEKAPYDLIVEKAYPPRKKKANA